MDEATELLLRDLEASPTDLRKLVVSVLWRNRGEVAIESEAIARWKRDDPRRWAAVQAWLAAQEITILVLKDRATPGAARGARSAPWRQPPPGTAPA